MKGNEGVNRLANAILGRGSPDQSTNSEMAELGRITENMSLALDHFSIPFPPSEYLVSELFALPDEFMTTTELGSGAHSQYQGDGRHDHKVLTPEALKPLKPGDRVLVVWAGKDPVVLCRVVSGGG